MGGGTGDASLPIVERRRRDVEGEDEGFRERLKIEIIPEKKTQD